MSEDISYRQRRYLIMMGIRVVGLILAVFLFHGVARFIAAAVAIVMPYFAVVFANGGREPDSGRRFQPYDPDRRELPESGTEGNGYPPRDGEGAGDARDRWDQEDGRGPRSQEEDRDPRDQEDGRPGGEGSMPGGDGSLSAEQAAGDPGSQSRTRSNRA